jgi:hypothetical protein
MPAAQLMANQVLTSKKQLKTPALLRSILTLWTQSELCSAAAFSR